MFISVFLDLEEETDSIFSLQKEERHVLVEKCAHRFVFKAKIKNTTDVISLFFHSLQQVDMLRPYKFVLAFENSNVDDYVSEKFFQAFVAGTVPGEENGCKEDGRNLHILGNIYTQREKKGFAENFQGF